MEDRYEQWSKDQLSFVLRNRTDSELTPQTPTTRDNPPAVTQEENDNVTPERLTKLRKEGLAYPRRVTKTPSSPNNQSSISEEVSVDGELSGESVDERPHS